MPENSAEKMESQDKNSTPKLYAVNMTEAFAIFKENSLQTIAYWSAFLTFGMCVAVLGPTMLDLGCITKSTITEMSWVIFAQVGSTLLGSILAGFISNLYVSLF